ncbi:MAG: hypothetical protein V7K76_26910, partial [Nostoc sp.]
MIASIELRQLKSSTTKQFLVTASSLAEFLDKSEQQELILLQRMQDMEAKEIYTASHVSLIFLFGPTGVGKTTLLSQVMKIIFEQNQG